MQILLTKVNINIDKIETRKKKKKKKTKQNKRNELAEFK